MRKADLWIVSILAVCVMMACGHKNRSEEISTAADRFSTENQATQAGILLKTGLEYENVGALDSATVKLREARSVCSHCPLEDSIATALRRVESTLAQPETPDLAATAEESATTTTNDSEELLRIGEHKFGVQFIWDGYGTATITEKGPKLMINGSQYSKDRTDYLLISGEVFVQDKSSFTVDGKIESHVKDCCGEVNLEDRFTFKRTGNRQFYRLQKREMFCPIDVCAYYIDLFL